MISYSNCWLPFREMNTAKWPMTASCGFPRILSPNLFKEM
jgi:hypothetical protein